MNDAAVNKNPKKQKTLADYQAKLKIKRDAALQSAVSIAIERGKYTGASCEIIESALNSALSKVSGYLTSRNDLKRLFDESGDRLPPRTTNSPKPIYQIWTVSADPGFKCQIVHFSKIEEKREKVIDFETPVFVTPEAAKTAANEYASENSIEIFVPYPVWREGDREFEKDAKSLMNYRDTAILAALSLLNSGSKKPIDNAEVESKIEEFLLPLARYNSMSVVFHSQWSTDGKWIGAKKKKRKSVRPIADLTENEVAG